MSLQRHTTSHGTSLWRRYMVAMEISVDVTKTTSLQRFIMTSLYETLQRRHLRNVVGRFHHLQPYGNVRATSVRDATTTL